MSSIDSEKCLAIIEQGSKKGCRCVKEAIENGYCGKHTKQAILNKINENTKKCLTHRCSSIISKEKKYCETCIADKEEKKKNLKMCNAIIQQHENKGKQCDKVATNGEYCGKHFDRNVLIKASKNKGTRVCDDGKRACKNVTKDNKLKCEECLSNNREKDNSKYEIRRETDDMCLGCGKIIESIIYGFRKEVVKRCKECYEALKATEEKRERTTRDYNKERRLNIIRYFDEYVRGAVKRNLLFSLTKEQFEEIVTSHCSYCDSFNEEGVIGVDRINSNKGYTLDNVTPCCATCNIMKNDLAKEEFFAKVAKIYKHSIENNKDENNINSLIEEATSYIRPRKILEFYKKEKLNDYYKLCESDYRSPLFLEKIKELSTLKFNERECISFIQNALRIESNAEKKTLNHERKRISKKVLHGYLNNNQQGDFINLYRGVHGEQKRFEEDIKELFTAWQNIEDVNKDTELTKVLVRYQNIRNRKC